MFTSYLQYFFVNFEKDFAHKVTKTHANLSYTEVVARKNFAKFTGKHLCQGLWHRYFLVNFAEFLRAPFLQNTSGGGGCFYIRL